MPKHSFSITYRADLERQIKDPNLPVPMRVWALFKLLEKANGDPVILGAQYVADRLRVDITSAQRAIGVLRSGGHIVYIGNGKDNVGVYESPKPGVSTVGLPQKRRNRLRQKRRISNKRIPGTENTNPSRAASSMPPERDNSIQPIDRPPPDGTRSPDPKVGGGGESFTLIEEDAMGKRHTFEVDAETGAVIKSREGSAPPSTKLSGVMGAYLSMRRKFGVKSDVASKKLWSQMKNIVGRCGSTDRACALFRWCGEHMPLIRERYYALRGVEVLTADMIQAQGRLEEILPAVMGETRLVVSKEQAAREQAEKEFTASLPTAEQAAAILDDLGIVPERGESK